MDKDNGIFTDEAPEYFRNRIIGSAKEGSPVSHKHPYLKAGSPRWMYLELIKMEAENREFREFCISQHQRKDLTWLFQIDGFCDRKRGEEYWTFSDYFFENCDWNARLYVAPETTRTQAITLAQGFVNELEQMTDEEFSLATASTTGPARLKACIDNELHEATPDNIVPFELPTR